MFRIGLIKFFKKEDLILISNFGRPITSVSYSTKHVPAYLRRRKKEIPLTGWLLLGIPIATFSLGVWQIRRKQWKEALIDELKKKSDCDPVDFPNNLEEINNLEYKPVRVKGRFLHDKELYLGPRTFLVSGDSSSKSSLMTEKNSSGYLVVTPFKLENRDETILINRGWVPSKEISPKTRLKGQIEGPTNVIGVVRLNEIRPIFSVKNKEGSNLFFYRDLEKMTQLTGALPIFLDATNDFDVPGGPIGGQTRITLRNEHMSYVLTWFTLCGATSYMWYMRFLK